MNNPIKCLREFGQSVWFDNIDRSMLINGDLVRMVEEDGLSGMTSNPTIFAKAIQGDESYSAALEELFRKENTADDKAVFYDLAIDDIQHAADILRPVYEESGYEDGMVSLEVSPTLAHDASGTIAEARSLHARVSRPNVMIKVPATLAGVNAVETLIADGINVNATLLFSVARYEAISAAYLTGLERRVAAGQDISGIASVASFFVSRVDGKVDAILDEKASQARSEEDLSRIESIKGRAAIANAGLAYGGFRKMLAGGRFQALAAKGARPQRLLWASTGTKNPTYSDILYVSTLIGPNTVNTMPPATYQAFKDHGNPAMAMDDRVSEAETVLNQIADLGINLDDITDQLEIEGLNAFSDSFTELLAAIAGQREQYKVVKAS